MQINGAVALVTGANRGLGRRLVEALLDRGAPKVYAAVRTLAREVHTNYLGSLDVRAFAPVGIDTEMIADIEGPRTPPRQVADGILAGIERGEEDIFPDPVSQGLSTTWFTDPKAYERAFSGR